MKYLLDTCVISELVRPAPQESVREWLRQQDEPSLFLSVLTLGELQKGVSKLADGTKRRRLQAWLDRELPLRFSGRLVAVDEAVALRWGAICGAAERTGRKLPVVDSLLAASALSAGLTLVTRNKSHFEATGVVIVDPWSGVN